MKAYIHFSGSGYVELHPENNETVEEIEKWADDEIKELLGDLSDLVNDIDDIDIDTIEE